MILRDIVVFPCGRHVLLCSSPVYEGISSPTKHSHSDQSLQVAVHFVVIILRIHTNGSTPILILCFRFFVAFAFVIRIMHKWNLSFRLWKPIVFTGSTLQVCKCIVAKNVDFFYLNFYWYQNTVITFSYIYATQNKQIVTFILCQW